MVSNVPPPVNVTEHILWYHQFNTTTGSLYYNADGAGPGAPVLIVTLDGYPNLLPSDIELV